LAAVEGNPEILQKIWEWAKKKRIIEELKKILLTTDQSGRIVWHVVELC